MLLTKSRAASQPNEQAQPLRATDLDLATEWLNSTAGQFQFSANAYEKGQWMRYVPYKDNKRAIRWLPDVDIDASILLFLQHLQQHGETLRITPARIQAIRKLAAMVDRGGRAR